MRSQVGGGGGAICREKEMSVNREMYALRPELEKLAESPLPLIKEGLVVLASECTRRVQNKELLENVKKKTDKWTALKKKKKMYCDKGLVS